MNFEDIEVGYEHEIKRVFTQGDVNEFATLSGDKNPVHWDEQYAATTFFKKPIVHGVLVISHMSQLLGMDFPGPGCILVKWDTQFLAPVYCGQTIATRVKVTAVGGTNRRVVLEGNTTVVDSDTVAIKHYIVLAMPK